MKSAGFSLIELMIVVAIIGVLSVMALPSYQAYIKRARFAEVITATQPFKIAITLALQEGTPVNELVNGKHGIPNEVTKSKNINSIKVSKGVIVATGSSLVDKHTYILQPTDDGSAWTISGTCLQHGLCNV